MTQKKEVVAKKPVEKKTAVSSVKDKKSVVKKADAAPKAKSPQTKAANVVRIKMIGSGIGKEKSQKATLKGLGMTKMNKVVELEDTPSVRGMIRKVQHLVEIIK
jgi:large subunit ribosomal protein L30